MPLHQYLPHFLARQLKTVSPDDFKHVVIPLHQAQRHPSVISKAEADGVEAIETTDIEKKPSSFDKGIENGQERRESAAAYDVHTIEGLRAEVDGDLAAFGAMDTAYDRT